MTCALYSGSFDPITLGHIDVMRRGARLFDRLVVAIGAHHSKSGLFSITDRLELVQQAAADVAAETGCVISVVSFSGLVIDAARQNGASVILRGLRNTTDFDYEVQMDGMNRSMAPEIDVVYLAATPSVRHIASSLVRQVAMMGGPFDAFVPPYVADRLRKVIAAPR